MKLKDLQEWIKGAPVVDYGRERTDSNGNEDEQRIYNKDGQLYSVWFCNGYPYQTWSDKYGFVKDDYAEPRPVNAKHTLEYVTEYGYSHFAQSYGASKFKPGNLADLLEDVTVEAFVSNGVETSPAYTYKKGQRGMVTAVRRDMIDIEFDIDSGITVPWNYLKITHDSPVTVFAMAKDYNRIRTWAGKQAGKVRKEIPGPTSESSEKMDATIVLAHTQPSVTIEEAKAQVKAQADAMRVIRLTQPFVTAVEAHEQFERVMRGSRQ